ncbi:MAG TPA: SdrD B-like domain-containing protein, partial [Isosphaeraceae bacterium]|nr:SdrD B-like domain-containing protein [Isosphaeraceae bacterium]
VQLLNGSSQVVQTATTDSHGDYAFTITSAGTYTIQEVLQSGYLLTTPASVSYTETLSSGQSIANLNFGVFQKVSFSGEVFNDLVGSGTFASGDPGLSGWTVDLLNSSNQVIATNTTDSSGDYAFAGIGPGSYTIEVISQTGYVATSAASLAETATSGQNVANADFGEFQPVTLSGEVFNDLVGSGTLNSADTGLSGWTVNLLNSSNQVIATKTTDSSGDYAFAGTGPGSYTIEVSSQTGYVATSATSLAVTTRSGQNVANENFGEFQPVTLSGEVFLDTNGDGQLDNGESGLSGWTINLVNGSSQVVQTTTSGTGGVFSFAGVGPGRYAIQVVQQAGYVESTTPLNVTTSSGQNIPSLNVGEFQPITVSGEVFDDLNDSGAFNTNDPGVSGWTVNLRNASNQVVQTTTTDPNGNYSFTGVGPGRYTIAEVLQAGYQQTDPSSGSIAIAPLSGTNLPGEYIGVVLGPVLSVTSLAITPSSGLVSGTSVTISWDDANAGGIPATTSFADRVTITNMTTGQVLGEADVPYNVGTSGPLNVGASAPQEYSFRLPDGSPGVGNIEFTVTADEYDAVSNGLSASGRTSSINATSTLANYADLVVAPSSLTVTPGSPQSGGSVTVNWNDQNIGNAAVNTAFTDYVLVQQGNTTIASGTVNGNASLVGGATSPQSWAFTLPNGATGTGNFQVTVTTDYYETVKEYNSQGNPSYSNNSATTTFTSTLAPYPDLQVTGLGIDLSSVMQSGGTVTIDWNDANTGTATASGGWYDAVTVVNTTTGQTVVNASRYYGSNSIATGGTAARTYSFQLPDGTPGVGTLQASVTADSYRTVPEYDASGNPAYGNNTSVITATSALAAYPDLVVSAVSGPTTALAGQ